MGLNIQLHISTFHYVFISSSIYWQLYMFIYWTVGLYDSVLIYQKLSTGVWSKETPHWMEWQHTVYPMSTIRVDVPVFIYVGFTYLCMFIYRTLSKWAWWQAMTPCCMFIYRTLSKWAWWQAMTPCCLEWLRTLVVAPESAEWTPPLLGLQCKHHSALCDSLWSWRAMCWTSMAGTFLSPIRETCCHFLWWQLRVRCFSYWNWTARALWNALKRSAVTMEMPFWPLSWTRPRETHTQTGWHRSWRRTVCVPGFCSST